MSAARATDRLQRRAFATRAAWRKWLAANHARRRRMQLAVQLAAENRTV